MVRANKSTFRELDAPPPDALQQFLENTQDEDDVLRRQARPRVAPAVMTTKQVKRAYLDRTRGPKLSKEERRRRELEELAKIKREEQEAKKQRDKERAANKARMLRDKKKEKEMKAREEKKKQGLPLVAVRPSQDMITRFFRGGPAPKDHGADDTSVLTNIEEATDDDDKDDDENIHLYDGAEKHSQKALDDASLLPMLKQAPEAESEGEPELAEAHPSPPLISLSANIQRKKRSWDNLEANSAEETPTTKVFHSENDAPDPIVSLTRPSRGAGSQSSPHCRGRSRSTTPATPNALEALPAECQVPSSSSGRVRSSGHLDARRSSGKSPEAPRSSRSRSPESPPVMLACKLATPQEWSQRSSQHAGHCDPAADRSETQGPSLPSSRRAGSVPSQPVSWPSSSHGAHMLPSGAAPLSLNRLMAEALGDKDTNETPATRLRPARRVRWADEVSKSPTQLPQDPAQQEFGLVPPSTQMYLLDNFEDLFPSATQEALELEGSVCTPPPVQQDAESAGIPMISSQDLIISTQDMRDMDWDSSSEATNSPAAQPSRMEERAFAMEGSIEHDLECFGSQLLKDLSSDDLHGENPAKVGECPVQQTENAQGQTFKGSFEAIDWEKALGLVEDTVDEDWFDF